MIGKMKAKGTAVSLLLLLISSSLMFFTFDLGYAQDPDITFTSGERIQFTSTVEMTFKSQESMQFWSGVQMKFTSTVKIQFIEFPVGDGILQACDIIQVVFPVGFLLNPCEWWEVVDPITGDPLGEFHVDGQQGPDLWHLDNVWGPAGGPFPIPPGINIAVKKIDIIEPCQYYEVHWPAGWYPDPCTWWEIVDPETGQLTGFEFHVDWTNESCEFHIDEVIPGPYILPFPWYEIWARKKIPVVQPCDYFVVEDPPHWWPKPCTWWEIMDPITSEPTGFEFHVDWTNESCEFHIDKVVPEPYVLPYPGVPYLRAERKIENITSCDWYIVTDPQGFLPDRCTWWEILDAQGAPTGLEFHVDDHDGISMFHLDVTIPDAILTIPPSYTVTVRQKIDGIQPCDWFKVTDPALTPIGCTWWEIIDTDTGQPSGWEFHVDSYDPVTGEFHVDNVIPGPSEIAPQHALIAEKKIDGINPCDWFEILDPPPFVPQPCSWWEITYPSTWAGVKFHVDSNDGVSRFHIDKIVPDPIPPTPIPPPYNVTAIPSEKPPLPWYMKPPYPDYAPSGMPDFDQKQDGWFHPAVGWSWCGPVACGNSIWWFDSKYDPSNIVTAYGPWDDHSVKNVGPLIQDLAWHMDTDGIRTGSPHTGTFWWDMATGLQTYLIQQGVDDILEVHSMEFPDFYWIEEEIYRCQDVVLLLQFWEDDTGEQWIYDPGGEGGHYVTCAGVNSTILELLISDPWHDAAEAGWVPGDVPVPHPYPHGVDIHNDTQYVSHDAYTAWFNPAWGAWELLGYLQTPGYGFPQTWHAFIMAAVVTSPLGVHDIAVTNLTSCYGSTILTQNFTYTVNITVTNEGDFAETFTLTLYWNNTNVINSTTVSLAISETKVVQLDWNTTGLQRYKNYTLRAYATPVPGETDVADNTFDDPRILMMVYTGDINNDTKVDIKDIAAIAKLFGVIYPDPKYNPNMDLDCNGKIDIKDVALAAKQFGYVEP